MKMIRGCYVRVIHILLMHKQIIVLIGKDCFVFFIIWITWACSKNDSLININDALNEYLIQPIWRFCKKKTVI
jgi:hypothetical protein